MNTTITLIGRNRRAMKPTPVNKDAWRCVLPWGRVMIRILKYVGAAVACVVVVVLSSALLYREYLQHKVAEERTISSPDGINSLEPVRIGGIDQWIQVRGQNVNKTIGTIRGR